MKSNLGLRIEEVILFFITLLTFLEFFNLLNPFFDYVKNVVSWTCLAYIVYHAQLSDIFFGKKSAWFDIALITTYFLFMMKSFTGYAYTIVDEAFLLHPFFSFIVSHATLVEFSSLALGTVLLFILSIFIAGHTEFQEPSLLSCLSSSPYPERRIFPALKRLFLVYFVLLAFFIIVFNLIMEWIAIVLDAPVLLLAILLYAIFLLLRRHFNAEGFLYNLSSLGEQFYNKFIHLFQRKETLFLGISGMLVLHLLTDIATFIVPMLTGLHDSLYFHQLGITTHSTLYTLFSQHILAATEPWEIISIAWIYFFNILSIFLLLLAPGLLWFFLFKEKDLHIKLVFVFLFYLSLLCFFLAPVFIIQPINNPAVLVGVDISNHLFVPLFGLTPFLIVLISFGCSLFIALLSIIRFIKHIFVGTAAIIISLFFGWYIGLFFYDQLSYYSQTIPELFHLGGIHFLFAFQFSLFLMVTIFFYIAGYFATIGEIIKEIKTDD